MTLGPGAVGPTLGPGVGAGAQFKNSWDINLGYANISEISAKKFLYHLSCWLLIKLFYINNAVNYSDIIYIMSVRIVFEYNI